MESEFYNKRRRKLQMLFEDRRLETFNNWIFDDTKNCSAAKLAEAGFYFTGTKEEPDSVQCFLCDKPLDGWDESDDPWAEHLSHSKDCNFAQLGQPEAALSVQQLMEFRSQLINKNIEQGATEIVQVLNSKFSNECLKLKKTFNGLKRF